MINLSDALDYSPADGTKAKAKYDSASDALRKLAAAYEEIAEDSDYAIASEFDEVIHKQIEQIANQLDGRHLGELNSSELSRIYEAVKVIRDTIREAGKLIKSNLQMDV